MAIVYVHSSGLGPSQWRRTQAALGGHAVPLSGYDDTPWSPEGGWEQDLALVQAALGSETTLVGHSYGGLLALHAARLSAPPRAVQRLVVWEPVAWSVLDAPPDIDDFTAWADAPIDVWMAGFIAFWNGPGAWEAMSAKQRAPFVRHGEKVRTEVMGLITDTTSAEAWAQVDMPTLLLSGAQTKPAASETCRRLAEVLPQAEHRVVPGCGHMGPLTHEAAFRRELTRFLDPAHREGGPVSR